MPFAHSLRFLRPMWIAGLLLSLLLLPAMPGRAQQAAPHAPATLAYANPLPFSYTTSLPAPGSMHTELRDPCIIRDGNRYYLVFTMWPFADIGAKGPAKPDLNSSPGIRLFVSKDLAHWTALGWLVKSSALPGSSPYKHRFWAPEIHKLGGKYYLIFTADNWIDAKYNAGGKPGYHAFVGVADKVDGPYRHITLLPDSACDTTLLGDSDGRVYAYMPFGDLFVQQVDLSHLAEGKVSYIGARTKIVQADNSDIGLPSPRYLEGPWAMKLKNKYYLFYAETYPGSYWTGVAYADSPLGPWHKDPRGRVFEGGHLAVFAGPDGRSWFSYRGEQANAAHGLLAVDPFNLDALGIVQPIGPTQTPQTVTLRPALKAVRRPKPRP